MGSSSSSSSCETAADTKYTHQSWTNSQKIGMVNIRSRRIKGFFGVHHAIVVNGVGDGKFRVYQWGTSGDYYPEIYATKSIHGQWCIGNLGKRKLSDVYKAAKKAAGGRKYCQFTVSNKRYNCNDWTQDACAILGFNITVHGNCKCVL